MNGMISPEFRMVWCPFRSFFITTRVRVLCLCTKYLLPGAPGAGCTWCLCACVVRRVFLFADTRKAFALPARLTLVMIHTPRSDIFRYLHRFMCDIDIASCTISRHVCGTRLVCGLACTHAWHVHMHYVCCLPIKLFFLLNISTPSVRSDSSSLRDASYVVTDREKPKQPQLLIKVLHLRN